VRTLTLRELGRATLARQFLLERRRATPAAAIARLAGMQAQWAPAPFVGLWSRLEAFERPALERALARGLVVKATVMRQTLHLLARSDYGVFVEALRDAPGWADPESQAIGERLAPELRALFLDGARTRKDAFDYLAREHGIDDPVQQGRVWHVARIRAHVVQTPESAFWQPLRDRLFHALDEPEPVEATAARAALVRRYLAAFGPASRADVADWSGLRVRDFESALERLEPLRRFRSEDGRELLDLPRAPLPAGDPTTQVRFLPKWDSVLLAHADRRRVLPEEYRSVVIQRNGDVQQSFLVAGLVAGTWRVERGRVVPEPFEPLPLAARREVETEAARLAAWLA
jgi:hypothetical protein